jgi:hypothetical protein
MLTIPDKTEAAEYYFTYINQVPAGDICRVIEAQGAETDQDVAITAAGADARSWKGLV